jgi:uncharacterized protein YbjT (DUF2867 family)
VSRQTVLLTGATGFVGSHAYAALVRAGFEVICATRKPEQARERHPDRVFRVFDVHDSRSVEHALAGVQAVVYLVHGMGQHTGGEHADYGERERSAAEGLVEAAARQGVRRIVYLGGMRPRGLISRHLASRLATGEILRAGAVPTLELQATMIVGGGSESFRIVRDLAARLPFMLLPRWLDSESEPVAIADVVAAICFGLTAPLTESTVFTLPGPERLSGKDILLRTARLLGQNPRVLRVPFVTPTLSSYWIRLVTRADPHIASELVQGLLSDIVADAPSIFARMPGHVRQGYDEAARIALAEEATELSVGARLLERLVHPFGRRPVPRLPEGGAGP